ncbi:MAG: hypothetical protein GVY33_03570 [Alphaproteobacteria bacterium]|jgi:hypothetical protein|nr:hypothetical protein [Alphaproteobacteria bacterium]
MSPRFASTLVTLATVLALVGGPPALGRSAVDARPPEGTLALGRLALELPSNFALDPEASDAATATPSRPPAARVRAERTTTAAARGLAALLPDFVRDLPVDLDGGEAVFAPAGWSLRVGRGATASRRAARADLSLTRPASSAAVAAAAGDVELVDGGGARVKSVFDRFDGLGNRPRARLDVALPAASGAELAASVAADGDADVALVHARRWRGLDLNARAAALVDRDDGEAAWRAEASAALRDRRSGWNLTLAGSGGEAAGRADTTATVYAKLARGGPRDVASVGAWSLDAAYGHAVGAPGDRAWLAGVTVLERIEGVGRMHLRYRYQRLDGRGGRDGGAHSVLLGARLKL